LCEWGTNKPWEWAASVGHLWRTTGDISPIFAGVHDYGTWSAQGVLKITDFNKNLRQYAGPGHWNDPDMLEVGNGMTVSEDRTHFSMWCMMAAPLMAGNDLRKMSNETLTTLSNKDVISIDQDSLGIQGFNYNSMDSVNTWFKPLQNGEWAVCFLNRGLIPQKIQFNWKAEKVVDTLFKKELNAQGIIYNITNLWSKKEEGTTAKPFTGTVPAHDVILLRLKSVKK
jgi:alpha-galactosidase